jgi:hypothetical protein
LELLFYFFSSSGLLNNTVFQKLDLYPSSGEGVGDTYSLVPLERANLNHWTVMLLFQHIKWHHCISKKSAPVHQPTASNPGSNLSVAQLTDVNFVILLL